MVGPLVCVRQNCVRVYRHVSLAEEYKGFDRRGHRMGRGGGFYDRFLARPQLRALTIGITFDQQVLAKLPVLSHDQAVQMIVTDSGIHRCRGTT